MTHSATARAKAAYPRNITILPAKPRATRQRSSAPVSKKRVCAYCRVSTDMGEQLESYEAQVKYYTALIKNKPDWEFAGIFADEGISGTSVKKRVEFMKMIGRCNAGVIDMVVTKSISRFARNTLDCLNYVRQLRDKGISVLFEKENIDTGDANGEVLLTILSSLAQDESRNISENTRWGIRQRFYEGRVWIGGSMLGYDTSRGQVTINEKQAITVRRIFNEYMEGRSTAVIARGLMEDGVLTGAGKPRWTIKGILTILKNEKYAGDALLQKTYTADFLTHKQVVNKGEMQQIFVEGSHEAIISGELFNRVQLELARRASGGKPAVRSAKYPFSGRMICPDCGNAFTRKIWDAGDPRYKRAVWLCASRYGGGNAKRIGAPCSSGHIAEKKLIAIANAVMERVIAARNEAFARVSGNARRAGLACASPSPKVEPPIREHISPDISDNTRRVRQKRADIAAIPFPDCHFPFESLNAKQFANMIDKLIFHSEKHMEFMLAGGGAITYQA